tara:strand:+ start:133720 stop:134835 length:1116 start_codon:yes stop_codon:yes gene_type:complete
MLMRKIPTQRMCHLSYFYMVYSEVFNMRRYLLQIIIMSVIVVCSENLFAAEPLWNGYVQSPWFDEQYQYLKPGPEVRAIVVAPRPERIKPQRINRVVLFTTPNGNTIEQTLGCEQKEGRDWHFDIQHIAAQHRQWQSLNERENLILVCLDAKGLSWPGWRARHPDNPQLIRDVIAAILKQIPLKDPRLTLACHSGGGSFLWGFLNGSDTIPPEVDRFVFLDANYSFSTADGHGKKFSDWLQSDKGRSLIVMAYDDRNVLFRGKKVVSPTGGTFRATQRMRDEFEKEVAFQESGAGDFKLAIALEGRIRLLVHQNPRNQILHTQLVGEMNGYLYGVTVNTPEAQDKLPGSPRSYTRWIQPEPFAMTEQEVSP